MRQLFSMLLVVGLLLVACSGTVWGDNLTVTVTKSDGTQNTKTGQESLKKALAGYTLSEVEGIEVSAGSFEWDDWYWLKANCEDLKNLKKFVVTDAVSSVADIPDMSIWDLLFSSSLKELHIAKLKRVGDHAFYGCYRLASVSLPAATNIGVAAFNWCLDLTSVPLPAATKIDAWAFHGCENLKRLQLGATPPSGIDATTFKNCPLVRELELINPDGTALTGSGLDNSKSLYKAVNDGDTEDNLWYGWAFEEFPAGNLSGTIDGVAFTNAASLEAAMQGKTLGNVKELTITGGTFQVPDWAFLLKQGKDKLKIEQFTIENSATKVADIPDLLDIPDETPRYLPSAQIVRIAKVQKMGENAFRGCTSLTSVSLPGATEIGKSAFLRCKNLKSVSLPGATEIGKDAFYNCTSLTSVSLPAATKIDDNAFENCEKLKRLQLGATPPSNVWGTPFAGCPVARELELINPDGTALTGSALDNAKSLYKAVNDGDTEDNLWYGWAFEEVPAGNLSGTIDGVAFTNATSLEAAMQGKTLGNVKELTITGGTFQVPDWTFLQEQGKGELKIEQFTIENGVERVDGMPDLSYKDPRYLPKAQEVTIAKMRRIGNWAFEGCTRLTSVSLPGATVIGEWAFNGCKALTGVSLPAATRIDDHAFESCENLTSVSLPAATYIGLYAFESCENLKSVSLPTASYIRFEAFANCSSLKTLKLGATPPSNVDATTFKNCPSERTLIITDAMGVPLVGAALATAADNYDGKEGDPHDGKWYGWTIEKNPPTMLSVIVEPAGAGTAKITSKDGGAVVNEGDKLTKDEVLVIDAKPNDEHQYKLKEVTAKGTTNTSGNEWMVTANPGEQVVFTVIFEKKPEGESNNPTPVESVLLAQAQLSPNPTDGQVTVDAGTTLARCEVYSSTGALLQAIESPKSVFTIDLTASPSGVYLVRLVDVNGESKTLRAVKQ